MSEKSLQDLKKEYIDKIDNLDFDTKGLRERLVEIIENMDNNNFEFLNNFGRDASIYLTVFETYDESIVLTILDEINNKYFKKQQNKEVTPPIIAPSKKEDIKPSISQDLLTAQEKEYIQKNKAISPTIDQSKKAQAQTYLEKVLLKVKIEDELTPILAAIKIDYLTKQSSYKYDTESEKITIPKFIKEVSILNSDSFSRLLTLTLNPQMFCDVWYDIKELYGPKAFNKVNEIIKCLFIEVDKSTKDTLINKENGIRDTNLFKILLSQNIKSYKEVYIIDKLSKIENFETATSIEELISDMFEKKVAEIKASDKEYILITSFLNKFNDYYDANKSQLEDMSKSVDKQNIVWSIFYYINNISETLEKIKSLNLDANITQINNKYFDFFKSQASVLTYVRERNDTYTKDQSNPRYIIDKGPIEQQIKEAKLYSNRPMINFFDFKFKYFNYPKRIGIKNDTDPYKGNYKHEDAVNFTNNNNNQKYFETYNLGKINGYYKASVDPTNIANDPFCGLVFLDKLRKGENIIIVGNGQSGAGKTASLINRYDPSTKTDYPGILPNIAKEMIPVNLKLEQNTTYQTAFEKLPDHDREKYFYEAELKMINVYMYLNNDLSDPASLNKMKSNHYLPYYIKINDDNSFTFNPNDKQEWICINNNEKNKNRTLGSIIAEGFEIREVEPTKNNPNSSRSHIIVCITFKSSVKNDKGQNETKLAKVVVCDLAGVEDEFTCSAGELFILDRNICNSSTKYMIGANSNDEKPLVFDNYFCLNPLYKNQNMKMDKILQERYKHIMELNQLIDYDLAFKDNNIKNQFNIKINDFLATKINFIINDANNLQFNSNTSDFTIKQIESLSFNQTTYGEILKKQQTPINDTFKEFKFTPVTSGDGCTIPDNKDKRLELFMKKPEGPEQINAVKNMLSTNQITINDEVLKTYKDTKTLSTAGNMIKLKDHAFYSKEADYINKTNEQMKEDILKRINGIYGGNLENVFTNPTLETGVKGIESINYSKITGLINGFNQRNSDIIKNNEELTNNKNKLTEEITKLNNNKSTNNQEIQKHNIEITKLKEENTGIEKEMAKNITPNEIITAVGAVLDTITIADYAISKELHKNAQNVPITYDLLFGDNKDEKSKIITTNTTYSKIAKEATHYNTQRTKNREALTKYKNLLEEINNNLEKANLTIDNKIKYIILKKYMIPKNESNYVNANNFINVNKILSDSDNSDIIALLKKKRDEGNQLKLNENNGTISNKSNEISKEEEKNKVIDNEIDKKNKEIENLTQSINVNNEKIAKDKNDTQNNINAEISKLQNEYKSKLQSNYDSVIAKIEEQLKKSFSDGEEIYKKLKDSGRQYELADVKTLIRDLIRFRQLEFNCKLRRQEGYMINTSLKEMQKFIGQVILESASKKFNTILRENNLIKMNDKSYALNDIIKYFKKLIYYFNQLNEIFIDITAFKEIDKQIKNLSGRDLNKKKGELNYDDKEKYTIRRYSEIKDICLNLQKYITKIIKYISKNKDNYDSRLELPNVILILCFIINLVKVIGDISTNYSSIDSILKNMEKLVANNASTELIVYNGLKTEQDISKQYNSIITGIKAFEGKDKLTNIKDISGLEVLYKENKINFINNSYDDFTDNYSNLTKHFNQSITDIINNINDYIINNDDNLKAYRLSDEELNNNKTLLVQKPTPLLFVSPRIDTCTPNKYKYENEFSNYYPKEKLTPQLEILFKVMKTPENADIIPGIKGYGLDMGKSSIVIFTVINITSNPNAPTNNPPNPPFININKLKLIHKIISSKYLEDDKNNLKEKIDSYRTLFLDKLKTYPFYEIFLKDTSSLFSKTLNTSTEFLQAKNLLAVINFIDSNNATTLIGTVDFDRFTQIRDPNEIYYICDDKYDSVMKQIKYINEIDNILPVTAKN